MKKITNTLTIIIFSVIIVFIASGSALSADALYRMLHADDVESFKKDQDAIIVGQLRGKQADTFSVRVLRVLSGEIDSDNIQVTSDFTYGYDSLRPAVYDYCVMSLKKEQGIYKKAWGIFKADGGDYQTLKLVDGNASPGGPYQDLACIEWYVNSGGTEKDFSFDSGRAYVRRANGKSFQIYPNKKPSTTATTNATDRTSAKIRTYIPVIAGILFLFGILLGLFRRFRL